MIVKAENVRRSIPLAVRSEAGAWEFGTAYKRDGVVIIARADRKHMELRNEERVEVSYDPEGVEAAHQRWCLKCETKHLRRILADKHATPYCDASAKRYRGNAKTGVSERAIVRAEKAAAREERVERAATRQRLSTERMMANGLRGIAKYHGTDSTHFAKAAHGFGITLEQAIKLLDY
jgi:hypothetical protein